MAVALRRLRHGPEGQARRAGPPTTAQAGSTTIVAVAPPAPGLLSQADTPGFLGLTGLFQGLGKGIDCIRNRWAVAFPGFRGQTARVGHHGSGEHGTERAARGSKAAAEIKAEEDAAPQKIKALRYLATIGCAGCYPGVEEGLLAALDDCTESVRYEAVKALRRHGGQPLQDVPDDGLL